MDLLSGYDSAGSSSDSTEEKAHRPTVAYSTLSSNAHSVEVFGQHPPTKDGKDQRQVKLRRKMLALNAVLPPEILEQLTKRQMQGDADDEDSDEERILQNERLKITPSHKMASSGLKSLLDELRSTKATNEKLMEAKGSAESKSSEFIFKEASNDSCKAIESSIGLDLIQTSITSITKTKGNDDETADVVNIHGAVKNNVQEKLSETSESNMPSISNNTFTSLPIKRARLMPSVEAAPVRWQADEPKETSARQQIQQHRYSYNAGDQEPLDSKDGKPPAISSRQGRKDLERALRKGKLDAIFTASDGLSGIASEVYQHVPSHQFDEHAHAQTMQAVQQIQKKGSFTVKMYDPHAGTTVDTREVTSKHRAKHQIHQLAQSAIALEASRLTNPKGNIRSSRADAKRKYGW